MREVEVFKYIKETSSSGEKWKKYSFGFGYLLGFGVGYREALGRVVQFSTAIVEMWDSSVQNIKVECIKFTHPCDDKFLKKKESPCESEQIYRDEKDDIPF
jgi:hypothetical protein